MPLLDDLTALAPVANNQSSWVKELLDKRYQPQQERLKRSPVGFDFKREPFDPSSYYKQLGTFRDISRQATNVTRQEVANKEEADRQRAFESNQQAMMNSLSGIDPRFTYSSGSPATDGSSRKYGLKGVTSNTAKAADYFGSKYGISNIGGLGPGSVPGSDHPNGRALDYMTSNRSTGTNLANDIIQNAKAWNVKYVIWNKFIWEPGSGWTNYNGSNPHTDHVHVSFNR